MRLLRQRDCDLLDNVRPCANVRLRGAAVRPWIEALCHRGHVGVGAARALRKRLDHLDHERPYAGVRLCGTVVRPWVVVSWLLVRVGAKDTCTYGIARVTTWTFVY